MSVIDKVNVFRELADVLPFGVAVVALDGTILYWNNAAERIRGYHSHEVVGRRCGHDPLPVRCEAKAGSCEVETCPQSLVVREHKALDTRVLVSHRDGHRLPVRMHTVPVHDERGNMVAVAEVFAEQTGDDSVRGWLAGNCSNLNATGNIPGLAATEEQLQRQLQEGSGTLGIFLIGVEGLDEAAKRYGAGIRVVALRALAQTLVCVLEPSHFIGSWTADRFLMLVPECTQDTHEAVSERLQRAGSACAVTWWGDHIRMRVRATSTLADSEDSIATVMQRLEDFAPVQAAGGEQ